MEANYLAFRRWLFIPIILWQGDWIPRDLEWFHFSLNHDYGRKGRLSDSWSKLKWTVGPIYSWHTSVLCCQTLGFQTPEKVFGHQKHTIQTPNLRRYDWKTREMPVPWIANSLSATYFDLWQEHLQPFDPTKSLIFQNTLLFFFVWVIWVFPKIGIHPNHEF